MSHEMTTTSNGSSSNYWTVTQGFWCKYIKPEDVPSGVKEALNESIPSGTIKEFDGVHYRVRHGKVGDKPYFKIEQVVNNLTGRITSAWERATEFNTTDLMIKLTDSNGNTDVAVIGMLNGTRLTAYAKDFICRIPGIQIGQEVSLRPYEIPQEGTEYMNKGIVVYQNSKIEKQIKAGEGEAPNYSEVSKMGKLVRDYSAFNEYLYDKVLQPFIQLVDKANTENQAKEAEILHGSGPIDKKDYEDPPTIDLPF